jgi:hypothetical protein
VAIANQRNVDSEFAVSADELAGAIQRVNEVKLMRGLWFRTICNSFFGDDVGARRQGFQVRRR